MDRFRQQDADDGCTIQMERDQIDQHVSDGPLSPGNTLDYIIRMGGILNRERHHRRYTHRLNQ